MNVARFREAEAALWSSVGVVPTERRLDLARTGTSVRVQEAGDGPPIVLVHGASNGGSSWAQLVAKLGDFRCIVLDRPGCGLSAPLTRGFDDVDRLATFADALVIDVLDALELKTSHLLVTSFGGYIGLRTAAAHADRVDRLVALGWSIGAPTRKMPAVMRAAAVPGVGRLVARVPMTPRAVRMLFRQIGLRQALAAGRVPQEALDWYLALLRDTDTMRNEIAAGPRVILPLKGMNASILLPGSVLGSITVPSYFLWGEEDPFGGADIASAFVAQVPGAQLELMPGAGHAVWMDDADHVATRVRAFLNA